MQFLKTFGDRANRYTLAIDEDGHYSPEVVSNAQFLVGQSILDGTLSDFPELQTAPNTITQEVLNWVQSPDGIYEPKFICGGDSMASSLSSFSIRFRRFRRLNMVFVVLLSHIQLPAKPSY